MKRIDRHIFAALAVLVLACIPGCEVIGGIFKAGVGVGVFIVVLVIALVIFIATRAKK